MRRLSGVTLFWLLELYALLFVLLHMSHGVLTDEAKYLLSIPYPHPPFLRAIMASTASFPLQEFLWRFLFASAVIQCVWFAVDLGEVLQRGRRSVLVVAWLLSAPVLLQAGSIVLVVMSALFGMFLLWLTFLPHDEHQWTAPSIALVWLAALFTALPSILFFPLVWSALRKAKVSTFVAFLYFFIPVALLLLYMAGNPLLVARVIGHTAEGTAVDTLSRLSSFGWIWLLGGGVLSVVGTWGILRSGKPALLLTFLFVCLYIVLSPQDYYAILFVPLFIGGLFLLLCRRRISTRSFLLLHVLSSIFLVFGMSPFPRSTQARTTMQFVNARNPDSFVILDGYFGHEWEYESTVPVRRFSQALSVTVEDKASFIICTRNTCQEDVDSERWTRVQGAPQEVWEKRLR